MILGVCGNIASGKSTFLRVAEEQGWLVINSDKIVHELYSPGKEGQRRVSDFFGEEYIQKNGHVNRKKLGKIVFGDIKKLKILNALIHPLVINEIQKIIDKNKGRNTAVESVYFEDKYLNKVVDKIVLIERPKAKIKIELANRGVDEKLLIIFLILFAFRLRLM